MRLRCTLVAVAAAVALVAAAGPASAHEEITPKVLPTGQPTFLTLTAANERENDLVKVVLHAPAAVTFGETTRSPAGWSVTRSAATITWTGGTVKPDNFEHWGFEIDGADEPGTLAYRVTLGYRHANGDLETNEAEVDVNAVVPAAAPAGAATTASAAATVTTGTASQTPAQVAEESKESDDGGASGTAKAAMAIAILALLVAAGALALGARRRGPGSTAGGLPGGDTAAGGTQDW